MALTPPAVPAPGVHGDDVARVARALGVAPHEILDLATTLNPLAPDVVRLAAPHLHELRRYPDEDAAAEAVAAALAAPSDRVVLTNGGAEAIALVAAVMRVGRVVEPEFALYRRHLRQVSPTAPSWRSNPNNPTGRLAGPAERAAVWDEAHYALATGRWTSGDKSAIVVGSLTKIFACPGLRIGYIVARSAAEAEQFRARRPYWTLNAIAAAVVPELLALARLEQWCRELAELRRELARVVAAHGLEVSSAQAPWILVSGRHDLRERLAQEGVLVRDCRSFGLDGVFRVALPRAADVERFENALAAACRQ